MTSLPSSELGVLVRTLSIAGFDVVNAHRHPGFIEIDADKLDVLDRTVPYRIVISDGDGFAGEQRRSIERDALTARRVLVLVAGSAEHEQLSREDLLERLGGAVPSWRALGSGFAETLATLSRNELPVGEVGEAWRLFEEAVADGLEFLFGLRATRLGSARRGHRVGDLVCPTPDDQLILVDAKASAAAFSLAPAELRPLVEYVRTQARRQHGSLPLTSALIVAPGFAQEPATLLETCNGFLTEAGVPLACLTASALGKMIQETSTAPLLRGAIRWRGIFSRVGLVDPARLTQELDAVRSERVQR